MYLCNLAGMYLQLLDGHGRIHMVLGRTCHHCHHNQFDDCHQRYPFDQAETELGIGGQVRNIFA